MSVFNNKTITNAGMQLLAKGMAGETITFKSIVLGSGTFTGDDLASQQQVVNVQNVLPITSVQRKGSNVSLTTTLTSQQIKNDYNWSELGVIACGDDEEDILYLYGHTTQTSIISKSALDEKIIQVTLLVSNIQNVNAVVDDSMVFLTLSELTNHNESEQSHEDIRTLITNNRLYTDEKFNQVLEEIESMDLSWDNIKDKYKDIRGQNKVPNDYVECGLTIELTTSKEIGINNVHEVCVLNTYCAWNDFTGGVFQFATMKGNVKKYYRQNTDGENWGEWNEVLTTFGGTIRGAGNGITFHGVNNANGIYATNGDGASIGDGVDQTNLVIKSWYGVGFANGCPNSGTENETTVAIDCRTGSLETKGDIKTNEGVQIVKDGFPTMKMYRPNRTTYPYYSVIEAGTNNTNMQSYNTEGVNTRRILSVCNSNLKPLANAITLSDVVNGSSKVYNLYGEHNKPPFRTLEDGGFVDSQFSPTDTGTNMYTIFNSIPNYSITMNYINSSSRYPNLYKSILAKAKADLGLTAFNANECLVKFEKGSGVGLPCVVTILDNQTFKEYKFIYDRTGSTEAMSRMGITFNNGFIGGNGMYVKPSTTLQYTSKNITISKIPASNTFYKLGVVNVPNGGTIKVVSTVTKGSGATVESGDSNQSYNIHFLPITGGSHVTSSGTDHYKPLGVTSTDYANIAVGSTVTNIYTEDLVYTTSFYNYFGKLAVGTSKSATKYLTINTAGAYAILIQPTGTSNSVTNAQFNIKAYWTETGENM